MDYQLLVSPSRQCSSTPVCSGQGFLSKEQCDNSQASPLLPSPDPSRFLAVPSIEISIKGRRYCDATVIKNAKAELKKFSQNGFQQCFQYLYSRWQKFIVAQGDYFEENVS